MSFIDLNQNFRKQRFLKLLEMATADGVVTPEEVRTLQALAEKMGMSMTEVAQAIARPKEVLAMPPEVENRERLLYDMVMVMLADGGIHAEEVRHCRAVAQTLGFRPGAVEDLVKKAIRDLHGEEVYLENEANITRLFGNVEEEEEY